MHDSEQYGVKEYWASPIESLMSGKGDCEDYAILKYDLLLRLGIPESRLSFLHVSLLQEERTPSKLKLKKSIQHLVLAYRIDGFDEPLILDNVTNVIRLIGYRKDLSVNWSFDFQTVWKGKSWDGGKKISKDYLISKLKRALPSRA